MGEIGPVRGFGMAAIQGEGGGFEVGHKGMMQAAWIEPVEVADVDEADAVEGVGVAEEGESFSRCAAS